MVKFVEFLQEAARLEGLVWRKYRRPPARRAVEQRMAELSISGFEHYLALLREDRAELATLADRMHITVTRFFRDRECWSELATVLPDLSSGKEPDAPLRAWSAGCCGGEEPYSLAMVWLAQEPAVHREIQILASDLDEASLERARRGCYEKTSLKEIPPPFLERFFTMEKKRWCVTHQVTARVTLERRNIMADPVPTGFDLVLCRYLVFTYYRGERLRTAAERLWRSLAPGGILMVGAKEEVVAPALRYFSPLRAGSRFFRRRDVILPVQAPPRTSALPPANS